MLTVMMRCALELDRLGARRKLALPLPLKKGYIDRPTLVASQRRSCVHEVLGKPRFVVGGLNQALPISVN